MAENKMDQVAAMFGKRFGEEFTIKRSFGFDFEGHFSERGFEFWGKDATNNEGWYSDDGRLILELLTGEAVIVDD